MTPVDTPEPSLPPPYAASQAFTPASPVDKQAIFAGRTEQLTRVIGVIGQKGQHAVLFGERGVGKTSLANVLDEVLQPLHKGILTTRVNCDAGDTYAMVWRKVFDRIPLESEERTAGFHPASAFSYRSVADNLPPDITSLEVRRALEFLSVRTRVIIILDEFDRIEDSLTKAAFADTIKMLSDYAIGTTMILVGVADSIDELIMEHESIERALVQVHVPRMSQEELGEIITKGLGSLGMQIEDEAHKRITNLSRGLPHYTHLLALHSTEIALSAKQRIVGMEHVRGAIQRAIENAHQSTRNAYHRAVSSSRKDSLYVQALLACALAPADPLGYFSPVDVREPMSRIMGEEYDIENFIQHLNKFCAEDRGKILQRTGESRRYRYRFRNPVMQPFVILQGYSSRMLLDEA
jgi:Cdc6-like AAA superfamily ATPase